MNKIKLNFRLDDNFTVNNIHDLDLKYPGYLLNNEGFLLDDFSSLTLELDGLQTLICGIEYIGNAEFGFNESLKILRTILQDNVLIVNNSVYIPITILDAVVVET